MPGRRSESLEEGSQLRISGPKSNPSFPARTRGWLVSERYTTRAKPGHHATTQLMLTRLGKKEIGAKVREAAGPVASSSRLRLNSAKHRKHFKQLSSTLRRKHARLNGFSSLQTREPAHSMHEVVVTCAANRKGAMPCQFVQLHPPGEGLNLGHAKPKRVRANGSGTNLSVETRLSSTAHF